MLTEQEKQWLRELLAKEREGEPLTEEEAKRLREFWGDDDDSGHDGYYYLDRMTEDQLTNHLCQKEYALEEAQKAIEAIQRRG
jgi:hypothetical protein